MSARDLDVRPDLECALREEITRKEERIRALETQLDHAQRTSPVAGVTLPQTPPPAATRPPIRLPVFDGAPVSVIADRVQALANARNAPDLADLPPVSTIPPTPASMPFDAPDGFEPTARLDAGELRRAHRALARSRDAGHHRAPAALLCLATVALWGGLWQMNLRERQNAARPSLQNAPDAPAIAAAPLNNVTPIILPEADLKIADSLPAAAAVPTQATERAGASLPRSSYTLRSIAPPPTPLTSPRHTVSAAADSKNEALPVSALAVSAPPDARPASDPKPERKPALSTRRQTALAQLGVTGTAASERISPNKKTFLIMPAAKREQARVKVARGGAWASHPRTLTLREQDTASARPLPASSDDTYGIREGGSPDSEEQDEEQAQAVHGPRSIHARAEKTAGRTSDIEANVDHAMQTLDKMRDLLDGIDRGRKTPAHP